MDIFIIINCYYVLVLKRNLVRNIDKFKFIL